MRSNFDPQMRQFGQKKGKLNPKRIQIKIESIELEEGKRRSFRNVPPWDGMAEEGNPEAEQLRSRRGIQSIGKELGTRKKIRLMEEDTGIRPPSSIFSGLPFDLPEILSSLYGCPVSIFFFIFGSISGITSHYYLSSKIYDLDN